MLFSKQENPIQGGIWRWSGRFKKRREVSDRCIRMYDRERRPETGEPKKFAVVLAPKASFESVGLLGSNL